MPQQVYLVARLLLVPVRSILEIDEGCMEDLVDDPASQYIDLFLFLRAELASVLLDLGFPDHFELFTKFLNRRGQLQQIEPGIKFRHFTIDDFLHTMNLSSPVSDVSVDDLVQRINVVKEHILDRSCGRIDVAGNPDIDDEEGPVAPQFHRLTELSRGENGPVRIDRSDDDIHERQMVCQPVEVDDRCV